MRRHASNRPPATGLSTQAITRVLLAGLVLAAADCDTVHSQPAASSRLDPRTMTTAEQAQDYPVVRVALGEAVRQVQARSTLRLPPASDTVRGNVNITEPVVLEFGQAPAAIRFPAGRFVALMPLAGHVVEVRLSPHLRSLTTDEALDLAAEVGRILESRGWRRARTIASPDSLRRASALNAGSDVYAQALAEWRRGNDQATITLKRLRSPLPATRWDGTGPLPARPDDRFLVDVMLENEPVLNHFDSLDRRM